MPIPNGRFWRDCREARQLTSDEAAQLLKISGGHLRQIETEKKPASGMLAARAAKLFRVPKGDLLKTGNPQPKPEPQPKKEPTAPPNRRGTKAPRRNTTARVA